MKREEVEKFITELVMPILKDTDLMLVDVEYVREKDWYLRIFIDKPEGIEIDDCQFVRLKKNIIWRFLPPALTAR